MATLSTTIEWLWSPANSRRTNKDRTIYIAWTLHDSAQYHFLLLLFGTMLLRGSFRFRNLCFEIIKGDSGTRDFQPLNIRSVQKRTDFCHMVRLRTCLVACLGGEGREGRSGYILMFQIVGEQQLTSFSFLCSVDFIYPIGCVLFTWPCFGCIPRQIRISNCCYIWLLVVFC